MLNWLRGFRQPTQRQLLQAIGAGWTLKSHRYLDGEKHYRLHSLDGKVVEVPAGVVERLLSQNFIYSNQKFPAATFGLTDKGREAIHSYKRQG